MEIIVFTGVAVLLYLLADRLLDVVERLMGRQLEHRSVIFFVILLLLALASFTLIREFAP